MDVERTTHDRRALLFCFIAITVGTPLYQLGDTLSLVPVDLRDRPWPFELIAVAACVVAMWSAYGSRCRLSRALVAFAVIATAAFSAYARVISTTLPPSDPTLPVGQPVPSLVLRDHAGARVALSSSRPSLLVFFRASNCPYCRSQLSDIAKAAPRFRAEGVRVVAVSPDRSESLARLKAELDLPFVLLSDERERAVALLCGGKAHCQILVDTGSVIRWATISESWSKVPAPASLLQAAYRLGDEAPAP